jgi:hypothetical protein
MHENGSPGRPQCTSANNNGRSFSFLFSCTKGFHCLYIGNVWADTVYIHQCNNRDSNLRPLRLKEHLINREEQSKLL